MPGSFSDFAENKILNHLFGGIPYSVNPMHYVGYMVGVAGESGQGAEPNTGGYARVPVANNTTNWPITSNQTKANANEIIFPVATTNHGLVQAIGIWDAPAMGNMLAYYPLPSNNLMQIGVNDAMKIPTGSLSIVLQPNGLSNYVKNAVLNWMFGGITFSIIPTLYLGYMTTAPSDATAGTEPSAGGYMRVGVANNPTNWPETTVSDKYNALKINWPEATGDQGTASYFGLWDAANAGNYLGGVLLSTPQQLGVDRAAYIPESLLHFTLD